VGRILFRKVCITHAQTIYTYFPSALAIHHPLPLQFLAFGQPASHQRKIRFCHIITLLMEHIINVTEVRKTEAASNHPVEPRRQDKPGSPAVSQYSQDYSLLQPSTPEPCLPSRQELQSSPVEIRKIANPAPLGLCAFALTSFLSNCINLNVGGIQAAGVSVSLALNYGGIAQVLAGMWYVLSTQPYI
jgi:hypothetical protein